MPTISVIIPCYNQGKFLQQTLNCILVQSFIDWECIIVDDGSSDNTKKIASNYCATDHRFKYFYQKNQGVSSARNLGIVKSTGQYIHFLDSDDIVDLDMYTDFINIFIINQEVSVVYGDFCFIDESNNKLKNKFDPLTKVPNYLTEFLLHNIFPVHAAIIKKNFLAKVGYFDKETVEDWDLWTRSAIAGAKFFHYKKIVCCYRIYPGESLSKNIDHTLELSENFLKKSYQSIKKIDRYKNLKKMEQLSYSSIYIDFYLRSAQLNNGKIKKICVEKIKKIPKCKILGVSKYHYFILGLYIDMAESSKSVYFYRLLPFIYLRKAKRWFKNFFGQFVRDNL